LTVLLIEDNPDYAKIVQHWLSQPCAGVEYVLNWTDSLAESLRRLARGNVSVILLDLNLPDSEGASTYTVVRSQAPEIPVIVLSAGDDVAMALQLIQEGADNYLVKSDCSAEALTRAIRYAVVKHGSNTRQQRMEEPPLDKSKVVAVTGGKGGVGTTTVACSLASELRRRSAEAVLLADLDMNTGLVAFLMAVESQYSLMDAVSNSARLDRSLWQRLVVQSGEGVDVLCSPSLAGSVELPEQMGQVLAAIKPLYRWIVLDLGRVNSCAPGILAAADELVVITTTGIPALYEARRAIETLRSAGMGDRIRLTVNQIEPLDACSQRDMNTIFGIEVSATLPSSSRELHEACVHKRMPEKNGAFSKGIAKLVQAIGGPQEPELRRTWLAERFRRGRKPLPQPAMNETS